MQFIMSYLMLFAFLLGAESESQKPIVLVELFTSEGCSSCPPADRLLSEMVNDDDDSVEVIALSFHVDYWDYIGWKDPYARETFTQRQRTYARKFYANQVYTPQMVVNGKYEFVGSDRSKWESHLDKLRTNKMDYNITLESSVISKGTLSVWVSSTTSEKVILNVAIVERSLSQEVTRGENRGKKLEHDNVVRSFESRQFDGKANLFELNLPDDLVGKNASLIVYAQHVNTWEVVGAMKSSFPTLDRLDLK